MRNFEYTRMDGCTNTETDLSRHHFDVWVEEKKTVRTVKTMKTNEKNVKEEVKKEKKKEKQFEEG